MDAILPSPRRLLLLGRANGAPILGKRLRAGRRDTPLDRRLHLADYRPLLGPGRTVRGVVAAVAATTAASWLLIIEAIVGVMIGAASVAGDALSCSLKRRLGVAPGQVVGWARGSRLFNPRIRAA
jgi:CDP-2,3-bis-(O-geranylgeranyl)-sn-glycerol synthase